MTPDIADIIAGELKVSRGTAYDMMREALAEQQEPVVQNNCVKCANADSWGLPDKPFCRSCVSNSEWKPLNASSKNPATPPAAQKPWVDLSDEEIDTLAELHGLDYMSYDPFVQALNAKLRENNT